MLQRLFSLAGIVLILLLSCKHEFTGPKAVDNTPTGAPADTVCFTSDVLPFFQGTCATLGCHDTTNHQGQYEFFDYRGISKGIVPGQPGQSPVMKMINNPDAMHKDASARVNAATIALLNKWILQRAKYTVCDTSCDTSTVTFGKTVIPVIQKYCINCHGDTINGGGYLLTTYTEVKKYVDNGWLYHAIVQDNVVSPMPKYSTKLSHCNQRKFIKWINAGAPNN